ncbi:MAG: hypothetical protein CVU95_00990 [Firmicutes bacterium HGW-Firmicutes-2]|jgi:hypothetical protein|nr:MAG: hypothetical protein CVU95_00990 [Firmicutes bacterium HGW-Firmicutes-2]
MNELLIGIIGFVITSSIGLLARMIRNDRIRHQQDHEMLKIGMTQLLKSQILDIYNRSIEKGHVGEHEKDVANDLYKSYESMGGNGYMKQVMEKIGRL